MSADPLSPYGFTVIEAATVMTKTHTPQGVIPYSNAKLYRFHPRELPADAAEWHTYLSKIAAQPHVAIIRAAPIEGLDLSARHRRLKDDRADAKATLRPVPRAWIGLDWDAVPEAAGHDWKRDARASAEATVLEHLPPWLRSTDFVVSFTGSHGLKDGMRLRSFHLLDQPLDAQQLKVLFAGTKADPVTFRDVQVHYTAAPIFDGVADPLPGNRHHLIRRAQRLATVPPLPAIEPAQSAAVSDVAGASARPTRPHTAGSYARRVEDLFSTMFETKDGGRGFYVPALSLIGLFYAVHECDADVGPLLHRIERTIRANCDMAAYPKGHVEELMSELRRFATTLATRPVKTGFQPANQQPLNF